ncbi:hypothetical protein EON65_13075 [archaeon]|nr:MAG: hypothetical protein EON65_13075 [archaeon]
MQNLGIDKSNSKATKPKKYNKVKNNMVRKEDGVFQMDLIELPETKQKYKYLCTVCDLATDEFDCEALKTKTPKEVTKAFEKILDRPYLDKPYILTTDSGTV